MRHAILIPVLFTSLALGMLSGNVMAKDTEARVETTSVTAILENLDSIDAAIATNDPRVASLSDKDKRDLKAEQAKVRKLLAGKEALGDLPSRDRLTAYNSLETIYGIVSGNREDRVVCRREHTIGSNRPQTNCMTAKDRQQAREAAVQAMAVRGKTLPMSN